MSQTPEQVPVPDTRLPVAWKLALVASGLVGLIGLAVAVQQFLLKFLHDQSAHTRTVWGILFMLLGVLGPALPLLLVVKRRAFVRLTRLKQWAAVIAIPALYAAALGLSMLASTHTKTLIMGRPGLTLLVHYEHGNRPTRVEMHGLRRGMPSGSRYRELDGGVRRFHFEGYQPYLRYPDEVTISAEGASRVLDDGSVEITLDFDAQETFRLQIEGLADVQITRDGQAAAAGAKFEPGKYQVIIIGRPG